MLDDLKIIHERDKQDALGIAEKQWQYIGYKFPKIENVDYKDIENIVFAGMGGSALGAMFSKAWPGYNVPFEVCRNYTLPGYVGPKTLVVGSSYSGSTEETISAIEQAVEKGAMVAIISAGGELVKIAKKNKFPLVVLPEMIQPKYGSLYGLKALLSLLADGGLVDKKYVTELAGQAKWLEKQVANWRPDVAKSDNFAKQIALDIIGKSAVIYSSTEMFPLAYKWKISLNENAKNVAWCNAYPEFSHNEFVGWSSHPVSKPYAVIDLVSNLDSARNQKRFELSAKLLSGKRAAPIVVNLQGTSKLQQLLWGFVLGEFVSIYTAILNGQNPTPVELVVKFKKQLG